MELLVNAIAPHPAPVLPEYFCEPANIDRGITYDHAFGKEQLWLVTFDPGFERPDSRLFLFQYLSQTDDRVGIGQDFLDLLGRHIDSMFVDARQNFSGDLLLEWKRGGHIGSSEVKIDALLEKYLHLLYS
jgi:hypothetical protein